MFSDVFAAVVTFPFSLDILDLCMDPSVGLYEGVIIFFLLFELLLLIFETLFGVDLLLILLLLVLSTNKVISTEDFFLGLGYYIDEFFL
mmetsp:Transcript_19603/g.1755  ORF Transcript_19603/g.1755 Transcript_19603/m.1755 type:complete len:89 (+) Transcript_19603:296-562(+)